MTNSQTTSEILENASIILMQKAFERSAESFGHFLGKSVAFNSIGKMGESSILSLSQLDEPLSMVASEMKGDLKGTCYLIFSRKDARELCAFQLGQAYRKQDDLHDALLMELANILTASFVTVLANELNVKTYAHVPKLKKISRMEMLAILKSDEIYLDRSQKFKIHYTIEGIDVQPIFTWAFDANIYSYITKWMGNKTIS